MNRLNRLPIKPGIKINRIEIMKRVKFLMIYVFLLAGSLTMLAFTSDKYHKSPLALQCLSYTGPLVPFSSSDILNPLNWSPMTGTPNTYCDGLSFDLCAICFENTTMTANEARQILYDYYRENNESFPTHGSFASNYSGKKVWVYLKYGDE